MNMIPEPLIMIFQENSFNADSFINKKILELKEQFNINHAIELGTCLGYSAEWFCQNFEKFDTIENQDFWATKKVGDVIELKTGEKLEIVDLYKFEVVKGITECMVRYKDVHGKERDVVIYC